uniref:Uncharacterized protein n=1 Tax=viral metagenome TaxID=1070528 RepID=A0A6M3LRW8_9ZZZZ
MELEDYLVESLVMIGNHSKIVGACEPSVMQPLNLEAWMVRRALVALAVFEQVAKERDVISENR